MGKEDAEMRTIDIELTATSGEATVRISDNGIGISTEHLPHLFERFYRVRKNHADGTGLGLAITKRIIERHGGTITADSEVGSGSTFTIVLPVFDS